MSDTFRQDGYEVFAGDMPEQDLAMLRNTCDTLLAKPAQDGGEGLHNIGLGEQRRFLRHRHGDCPELKAFVLGRTMEIIARECLQADPFLFNEQFVVKGAGKGASFAWHQDSAYVGFDHKLYLTVWIALDDATEANGCVSLIPRDIDAQPDIEPHEWQDDTKELNDYFGDETGKAMECRAGDIVAFLSLILHRSGPNTTARPRRAYIAQYSAEPIRDPTTGGLKRFATPLSD